MTIVGEEREESEAFASHREFEAAPGQAPAGHADPRSRADVMRWRKTERERLIASRLAVSADARAAMAGRIAHGLDAAIGDVSDRLISLYWPFRGEPDLRGWMDSVIRRGGRMALAVVVGEGRPVHFRGL